MTGGGLDDRRARALDIKRCAGGGIIRSSVVTRYQLGLVFHAGSVIVPLSASTPHGTCESAMNAACSGAHVAGERGMELLPVEEEKPVLRRQNRRNGRAGRRVRDQRVDRLALVRSERRDVDERRHLRMVARFGDDDAAVRVADQNHRSALGVDGALGDGDVVGERDRRVLDDADGVAVLPQDLVDALPTGAVDEAAVDEDYRARWTCHEELLPGVSEGDVDATWLYEEIPKATSST